MNNNKIQLVSIRIPVEIWNELKDIAKQDQRSAAFIVSKVLTEYVEKNKRTDPFIIKVG